MSSITHDLAALGRQLNRRQAILRALTWTAVILGVFWLWSLASLMLNLTVAMRTVAWASQAGR